MILAGMAVTSAGIFGILSSGYEKAAVELTTQNNQIDLLNNKKVYFTSQIKNLDNQKSFYEQRAIQLSTLRKNQEQRLDNIYSESDNKRSAKSTENLIKQANIDIDSANRRVDRILIKITQLNDSIQTTDEKIRNTTLTNNRVGLDPLKYLSRVINKSADNAIKWFIALLISIFDPMAIMLLMAFNQMSLDRNKLNIPEDDSKESIFTKFKNNIRRKKKLPGDIDVDKALDVIASEIMAKDKISNEYSSSEIDQMLQSDFIEQEKFENITENNYIKEEPKIISFEKENKNNWVDNEFIMPHPEIEFNPPAKLSEDMNTTRNVDETKEEVEEKIISQEEKDAMAILKGFDPPRPPSTRMQADGGIVPN